MRVSLDSSIEHIKGIGGERAKLISQVLGIFTLEDLLYFFPYKYLDKSRVYKVRDLGSLKEVSGVQLLGKILRLEEANQGKHRRLTAVFSDDTGSVELVWFKYSSWLIDKIPVHKELYVFGKVNYFNRKFSIAHPEIEFIENRKNSPALVPVYSGSEKLLKRGINAKFFEKIFHSLQNIIPSTVEENLPLYLREKLCLVSRSTAFQEVHFPRDRVTLHNAERRLKFDEAFFFQLRNGLKKKKHERYSVGHPMPSVGNSFNYFYKHVLPFSLTEAQKRVLREIRSDMKRPIQMNRLLQGDVGSGKTMVALLTMLIAIDNGFQCVLMAPTEILAQQHYHAISSLLKLSNVRIALLTGSTKSHERRAIGEQLLEGSLSIVVGTHALLEDNVRFKRLGLAIIDEQHRFGVAQRAKLWYKNKIPPHVLVMTATPIPRTLAMSYYSDLEISVIDELPMGRKPVITVHRKDKDKISVFRFALEEIKKGRQVYFVYPLVKESKALDYKNLREGFEYISDFFSPYNVTMLHGQMKAEEKERNMAYFASGEAQIMVATTVIEVGVNVPNASVMIIESAERFGLSQLHQLRGRVGRGIEQSFCILLTSDVLSGDARKRIKTLCETHDGFLISEVDMQLRGPGDILGTQQSGVIDFKKLDLIRDQVLIKISRDAVDYILKKDPELNHPEHGMIKKYYLKYYKEQQIWGKIS
ncbi:MAG: ATP-dependent DNA helicase RecG [Bergeyella sp.]|nr:ATP-dependent DNA helicase RecG [Bergeyella sp.]